MLRSIWKGAISFGLVHIPVALYPATRDDHIDFDWLDSRTMDPVGYKRVNKRTGKEIDKAHIVRGVAPDGDKSAYVVLSDDEIRDAYPRTTQTIEIESFIDPRELPFVYLERPYYLGPMNRGDKVYALLRETLLATQRIGLARVVIHSQQHLAALVPSGPALVLNTLRWPSEIRTWEDIHLPEAGPRAAGLTERELSMARALVDDMTHAWQPDTQHNAFRDAVMALVERKREAGEVHSVEPLEPRAPGETGRSNVIDLTELLKRSLAPNAPNAPAAPTPPPRRKRRAS